MFPLCTSVGADAPEIASSNCLRVFFSIKIAVSQREDGKPRAAGKKPIQEVHYPFIMACLLLARDLAFSHSCGSMNLFNFRGTDKWYAAIGPATSCRKSQVCCV